MSGDQLPRRYRAIFIDLLGALASDASNEEAHLRLMESFVDRYHIATEPPLLLQGFRAGLRQAPGGAGEAWVSHRELVKRSLGGLLRDHGRTVGPADEEWFYEEYLRQHQSFVRLLPGAREALEQLPATGLHIGVVADCDTNYLDRQLCWLDISRFFDSRTTSEEARSHPPDEPFFHAALRKARCEPRQAIMAGNCVERDLGPAKALGMTTVLLDAGMNRTELQEADFVASHPSRMATILLELAYSP